MRRDENEANVRRHRETAVLKKEARVQRWVAGGGGEARRGEERPSVGGAESLLKTANYFPNLRGRAASVG